MMFPFIHGLVGAIVGLITTYSSSGKWDGSTASFTFTGDDVDCTVNGHAVKLKAAYNLVGDFDLYTTITTSTNTDTYVGVFDTAEDGTFNQNAGDAGLPSMTVSYFCEIKAGNIKLGSSVKATVAFTTGQTLRISRVSDEIKVYYDGVLKHTYATTSSATMRVSISGDSTSNCQDVYWTQPG